MSCWNDDQGRPIIPALGMDGGACLNGVGHATPGLSLRLLAPEDWFSLHTLEEARLWVPPPAAMETVVELFNDDRLAHPRIPHVFLIPRLMTHLWRKQLGKDADVMFAVRAGTSVWTSDMHEPLYVLIVLPITHVSGHRGPWTLRGGEATSQLNLQLETGFKELEKHGCKKFHDVEGPLPSLREGPETWSRDLLREFLEGTRSFPPVSGRVVRTVFPAIPPRPLPSTNVPRRRRRARRSENRGEASKQIPPRKKRRSSDGNSV